MGISNPHLDGHSSETQISWGFGCEDACGNRHSLCSIDCASTNCTMIDLLTSTPCINQMKRKNKHSNMNSETDGDLYLPKG